MAVLGQYAMNGQPRQRREMSAQDAALMQQRHADEAASGRQKAAQEHELKMQERRASFENPHPHSIEAYARREIIDRKQRDTRDMARTQNEFAVDRDARMQEYGFANRADQHGYAMQTQDDTQDFARQTAADSQGYGQQNAMQAELYRRAQADQANEFRRQQAEQAQGYGVDNAYLNNQFQGERDQRQQGYSQDNSRLSHENQLDTLGFQNNLTDQDALTKRRQDMERQGMTYAPHHQQILDVLDGEEQKLQMKLLRHQLRPEDARQAFDRIDAARNRMMPSIPAEQPEDMQAEFNKNTFLDQQSGQRFQAGARDPATGRPVFSPLGTSAHQQRAGSSSGSNQIQTLFQNAYKSAQSILQKQMPLNEETGTQAIPDQQAVMDLAREMFGHQTSHIGPEHLDYMQVQRVMGGGAGQGQPTQQQSVMPQQSGNEFEGPMQPQGQAAALPAQAPFNPREAQEELQGVTQSPTYGAAVKVAGNEALNARDDHAAAMQAWIASRGKDDSARRAADSALNRIRQMATPDNGLGGSRTSVDQKDQQIMNLISKLDQMAIAHHEAARRGPTPMPPILKPENRALLMEYRTDINRGGGDSLTNPAKVARLKEIQQFFLSQTRPTDPRMHQLAEPYGNAGMGGM